MSEAPAAALEQLRQLIYRLDLDEADRRCADGLAAYPEFRDGYGHPAFLKEALRLALLRLRHDEAGRLAEQLRSRLRPNDPSVHVLLARHHARMGDRDAARAAWGKVLEMVPNHAEARMGLQAAAVPSVIVNGVTMVPL